MAKSLTLLCWLVLGAPIITNAQRAPDYPRNHSSKYWVSAGLGRFHSIGYGSENQSMMVSAGYEPACSKAVFIGRYSLNGNLRSFQQPTMRQSEVGVLAGLKVGQFRFAAGLSSLWSYTSEWTDYRPLTIPLEVRYILPLKNLGIGITAFGNMNNPFPYVGLNLSIYGGKLK